MFFTKLLYRISHYLIRLKGTHALIQYAIVGIQQSSAGVVIAAGCNIGGWAGNNDLMITLQRIGGTALGYTDKLGSIINLHFHSLVISSQIFDCHYFDAAKLERHDVQIPD